MDNNSSGGGQRWSLTALLATWFGVGRIPRAPGTWGSVAALPCAWPLAYWGGWPALLVGALAIFLVGWWAAEQYERQSGRHDPKEVVIDEVAGQWLALLPAGLDPVSMLAAFILFRLFDILKPWPVSWAEGLPGGLGVMADDMLAGILAALLLFGGQALLAMAA